MSQKKKNKKKAVVKKTGTRGSAGKRNPAAAASLLKEAFRLHQSGQLDQAEKFYRQVLTVQPDHGDALHLLGVVCYQTGRFAEAAALIQKAIEQNPQAEACYSNLGNALKSMGKTEEALAAYEKALALKPDYAEAHYNLAVTLKSAGRGKDALEAYRKAIEIKPDYVEAHSNMANELKEQGKIAEAIAAYRKALEIRPDYAEAYNNLGNAYKDIGKMEDAVACYRKALGVRPDYIQALNNLGNVLNDMGRLDEAVVCYEEAFRLEPECEWAVAGYAKVLMRKGDFDTAHQRLRPIVDAGTENVDIAVTYSQLADKFGEKDRAVNLLEKLVAVGQSHSIDEKRQIHFNLGRLYDKSGDYDTAFHHYQQGNSLRPTLFNQVLNESYIQNLMAAYPAEKKGSIPKSSLDAAAPVFIVGMPRSGTTLVEQILSTHAKVFGAGELPDIVQIANGLAQTLNVSEPYPLCMKSVSPDILTQLAQKHLAWLQSLAPEAERITDKMPQNFLHMGLISQLFPRARIIHCMRDPRDTGLSIFFQNFSGGHSYAFDLRNIGIYYRQYQKLMNHWRQALDIPIMDVQYEELVENQEKISRQMLAFIGLDWDEKCLEFYKTERAVITASYQQVRRPLYKSSVGRWRKYEEHIQPLMNALSEKETPDTDTMFHEALACHQKGDKGRAESLYKNVLAINPSHPDALHLLGLITHQSGNCRQAEKLIKRAIQLNPGNAIYFYNLGVALKEQKKDQEALASYRKCLELDPNYVEAWFNLGNLFKDQDKAEQAADCYRRALKIRPGYAKAYNNLGNILKDQGKTEEAIACYQSALKIRPDYPEALNNMGSALKELGKSDEALACCDKALALRPNYAEAYNTKGNILRDSGKFDEGFQSYRRALELKSDLPGAIAGQADILMKKGCFEDAYALIAPHMQAGADDMELAVIYAQLAERFGHHRQAISMLEKYLEQGLISHLKKRSLHFELGDLHDKIGEYDTAFSHYEKANAFNRPRFDAGAHENFVSSMIAACSAEKKLPQSANSSQVPIFIVGMPRSGTTLAEQILSAHPQVCGAGELPYIGNFVRHLQTDPHILLPYPACMSFVSQSKLDEMAGQYLAQIRNFSADALRITDKMPQNFLHLGLICQLFPQARIIHCKRDPRDTGLSIYFQNFLDTHTYAFDLANIAAYYAQYERLMAHWKTLPYMEIFELSYEELVEDQERLSRAMIEFAGLEWDDACLRFYESKRAVGTASFQQVRNPIYKKSAGRWKRYEKYLEPFIQSLHQHSASLH